MDKQRETIECQQRRIAELESETQRIAKRETDNTKLWGEICRRIIEVWKETCHRIIELGEIRRIKELDEQETMDAHEAEVEAETKEV